MLAAEAAQLTAPRPSPGPPRWRAWRRSTGASRAPADGYLPIEHHGIIGDLHSVALVGNEGTIDWFCPGRFDAPSLFGAILDAKTGGSFSLQPTGEKFTTKQLYLPGTAVLVTRFFTESGVGEVVDFMPLGGTTCSIVRRVEVVRGSLRFRLRCAPAFDYARSPHRLAIDGLATFAAADKMCELRSPAIALAAEDGAAVAEFTLARGERASFVLSGHLPGPAGMRTRSSTRSRRRSSSGARGSARAAIAAAGARWSTAPRSRSSC